MSGLLNKFILYFLRTQLSGWSEGSIAEQRARQEKSTRFIRLPRQVQCQVVNVDGVSSEWIKSPDSNAGTILYLHGGAYALGSVNTHRELVARLVISTKCNALVINYRLAPENPFPAALEDVLTAYHWLLSKGILPSRICFAGDSAGGGLAIATLISLRESKIPLPACAVCISPWLNLFSTYVKTNNNNDPILNPAILSIYSRHYSGHNNAANPLISPIFADLQGLPPILIHVGTNEILLDDVKQFYENARQANIEVVLECWQGLFHVFQIIPFIPESKLSLEKIAIFIENKIDHIP